MKEDFTKIKAVFDQLDADGAGKLTFDELHTFLNQ
jgi:hypothetical protein